MLYTKSLGCFKTNTPYYASMKLTLRRRGILGPWFQLAGYLQTSKSREEPLDKTIQGSLQLPTDQNLLYCLAYTSFRSKHWFLLAPDNYFTILELEATTVDGSRN